MCRVFGCVAAEPVSIRHELLEAENPLIRQSEEHDSGWGMAVYERAEGVQPHLVRFPEAAHRDSEFQDATELRGRIFNVHVRRATMGALSLENTHPFCLGNYTLGHNGTISATRGCSSRACAGREGDTDSEHLFNLLMHDFDDADPVGVPARDASPGGGALAVQRAEHPLQRRREAVRLPTRAVRAALARAARAAAGGLGAGHR